MKIVDWSCLGEECEYVLTENSEDNHGELIAAGFSEEQIQEAECCDMEEIDLATIAFNHAGAKWFHSQVGFSDDLNIPMKRLPITI
ncbi:hypothetical protein [Paenibacillus sp. L3-i20]|uniref:hypothetical protein n=1 Tax=Paenibacillus sp. L3-i20 TaxID=2905833 RepID=UPI001EDD3F1F|nr:hypothetical protein [Paenibacillus sp. L3-i20]GKU79601.1 hypothetical protein L3i20_v239980 [Paenibacillus sp. L3-i20]